MHDARNLPKLWPAIGSDFLCPRVAHCPCSVVEEGVGHRAAQAGLGESQFVVVGVVGLVFVDDTDQEARFASAISDRHPGTGARVVTM